MNKSISQVIREIRSGDLTELENLYEHYYNVFSRYIDENQDVENIIEKYKELVKIRIILYFKNNCTASIYSYIWYTLELANKFKTWDYDELINVKTKKTSIKEFINEASTNKEARKELIEKYMYIIEKSLSNYKIDIEYEDALQIGYLLLIEVTNEYFDNYEYNKKYYFSSYIEAHISRYYPILLNDANRSLISFNSQKEEKIDTSFEDGLFQVEYLDYIERNISESIRDVFVVLLEQDKKIDIANELGIGNKLVSTRIYQKRKVLDKFFKIK